MAIESITQMSGIYVGHATDEQGGTGCTVICCPAGATGAVDVRGGAPATRETDLLRPEETVSVVHAVVLSGGSAFGLAAGTGVAEELERRGVGVDVGVTHVPIVCEACLFDLTYKNAHARPDAQMGRDAVLDAYERGDAPLPRGNVGAGTGCTVGKPLGPAHAEKAGIGEGVFCAGDICCCALAAVNALGNICDPVTGEVLRGVSVDGVHVDAVQAMLTATHQGLVDRTNTTISCIVTNARLTKAQATKVAQMASDAYAHTILPAHTPDDGDTVFVLATGEVDAPTTGLVGLVATKALERAIVDAARSENG